MTSDPVKHHILSQFGKRQMTTTQNLAERLEELSKKATPGPWKPDVQDGIPGKCVLAQIWDSGGASLATIDATQVPSVANANAALITELVNNLPTILSALRSRDSVIEDCARIAEAVNSEHGGEIYIAAQIAKDIRSLSSHAGTAGGWRPMSTAPRDGTEIFVLEWFTFDKSWEVNRAKWGEDDGDGPWETDMSNVSEDFLHGWQPLPSPPQSPAMIKAAKGGEI